MNEFVRRLQSYRNIKWLLPSAVGLVALFLWLSGKVGEYGATIIFLESALFVFAFGAGYNARAIFEEKGK